MNADEIAVDEVFATFFDSECDIAAVRAAEGLGHDDSAWGRFAETGGPGMALPAQVGGGGADLTTSALVAGHLGRTIAPLPFIEHTVASRVLASADPDHELLPQLAEGSAIATLAFGSDLVPAGAVADVILHMATDGIRLTRENAPRVAIANAPRLPLARRSLENAEPLSLASSASWECAVAEWQALMATALCSLGRRAVEIGVEYVKDRQQFGVPVGSFQGVQHGIATAITGVEGATLLASRAVWAMDSAAATPRARHLASMAFLFAAEAAQTATASALQYHGGYGYAEEYDIQMYYRRAKGWALQYGDPSMEYQRLADELLPKGV